MSDETLLGAEPDTTASASQQTTDATGAPAGAPASTPGGDQPNADGKKTEGEGAPEVPETYEFKMPDGMDLDPEAATEFSALAKEFKLSAENAQKVADIGAKLVQKAASVQAEQFAAIKAEWTKEVTNDAEIGGAKLQENLGAARKAIETFGGKDLRELLNATGFGNNPVVVKAFVRIGKAISEDGFVRGGATTTTDPVANFYPSMTSKG